MKLFDTEKELIKRLRSAGVLFAVVLNKTDRLKDRGDVREEGVVLAKELQRISELLEVDMTDVFAVSALEKTGIYGLKEAIGKKLRTEDKERPLIRDLLSTGDFVVLWFRLILRHRRGG